MSVPSLMQRALGAQWDELPAALKAHYAAGANRDVGTLDIDYPRWMQPVLHAVHSIGALLDKRGAAVPTIVEKRLDGDRQYWRRTLRFPTGEQVAFNSHWVYSGGNELVEYVNAFLGLRMAVRVVRGELHYEGRHLVLRIGRWRLPLPESLGLGHTTIVERGLDAAHFAMDFRLTHPLFGQVYRYAGVFTTQLEPLDGGARVD